MEGKFSTLKGNFGYVHRKFNSFFNPGCVCDRNRGVTGKFF